jgi:hypothetical protein
MNPYFPPQEQKHNPRLAQLVVSAYRWVGTPWRLNSSARGVGVSCHNLPRALYIESGALPPDFPRIADTPAGATALNRIEEFLDNRPEFLRLHDNDFQSGDLLGMFVPIDSVGRRIRQRCVNHLGVALPGKQLIHTLLYRNTGLDQFSIPPWSQTIIAAWRPLES